ncbi:uncharacterized protein BO96DRAFT_407654 [Aspergillus niger CBS 101883]|uniref:uncharacterized protein n=1 Tax=Aspergillus lacticoffeatus (strain CBS 101883) TaxID=1450533 RepID=UPI000D800BBB|nr:uncharacterized protein BO96DRAFT_407654 [Aspergillus niger CBS 101883]PYH63035.1 hypothetical protein BO96DRAFT_407654 [Aspergillus niger CBS 101883]
MYWKSILTIISLIGALKPSNEQVSHEPLNLDGGEVIRVGFELELAQGSCAYIGHGNRTGCRGGVQCGGTCSQRKDGREHYLASRGASRGAAEEGTRRTLAQGLYICSRKQVDKIGAMRSRSHSLLSWLVQQTF